MSSKTFFCLMLACGFLLISVIACGGGGEGDTPDSTVSPTTTTPLDNWQRRSPLPQANNISDIVYGNNMFVAVGFDGAIVTSPDGITWTKRTSETTYNLFHIIFANNIFVTWGYSSINSQTFLVLLTSPDGVTWTSQIPHYINDIAYGNNTFVAVSGEGGDYLTSPDGITWTKRPWEKKYSESYILDHITFANNTFMAWGYTYIDGGHAILVLLTSSDGIVWTPRISGTDSYISDITYGNNTFVALRTDGYSSDFISSFMTSPDGITWTERRLGATDHLIKLIYGNNTFVAVGYYGHILTSPDGISWTERASGTTHHLRGIIYSNNIFIAYGDYGTIVTSPDGVTWTARTTWTGYSLTGIAYGNNTFVAIGEFGAPLLASPDGITWTARTSESGLQYLTGIAYGNNTFVAVGYFGSSNTDTNFILSSPDGISWTPRASRMPNRLNCVTYSNNVFVTGGYPYFTSPDGITWTWETASPDGLSGCSIAYGNNIFVSVRDDTISTSPDGNKWTTREHLAPGESIYDIAYGNNTFVAIGYYAPIPSGHSGSLILLTSPDGITWTHRESPAYLGRITFGNKTFVAVGGAGNVLTSPDGITWIRRNSGTTYNLYDVTYGNSTFVVVGEGGTILQSGSLAED